MPSLDVRLTQGPDEARAVGRLAERDGRIFFELDAGFVEDPLPLSPFKLPVQPGVIEHRERDFGPLFGVFADSLPDGWGLLLMDRFLRRQGSALAELSPLDRLAFVGTRTLGALTYHPPAGPDEGKKRLLDLHEMAEESRRVLRGASSELLGELLRVGGSPGGARPKVLVGVRAEEETISAGEMLSGEDDLPVGFEHWMVKFAGQDDPQDVGPIEQAYAEMARRAGVTMPPTRLFEVKGRHYFGIRRFDRRANRRIHIHTLGNLIHSDFRIPANDYRDFLEVTRLLTRDQRDVEEAFRRMVFNVATHNRDDHVKNFTYLLEPDGTWKLAPAYDLIYAEGPGGEHTMTVAGEGRAPSREHVLELAEPVGIEELKAEELVDEVVEAVAEWERVAEEVGVSATSRRRIAAELQTDLSRL